MEINKPNPATPSSAYAEMSGFWDTISDILAGAEAIRAKGEKYLPKFPEETRDEFARRVKTAPWRPEFDDALAALVAKPFTREVKADASTDEMKAFIEDVDTRGSNLTQFARGIFSGGISYGLHWIFVEHSPTTGLQTLEQKKRAGVRPYFISVYTQDVIAVYFDLINGKIVVNYARIKEVVVERDGFGEKRISQIRELEPGLWRVYRQNELKEWYVFEEGVTSLNYVPLVPFFTGRRDGDHMAKPPLRDLADMQIELYRALARLDEIENFAGYPMLSANGFTLPENGKITVGPRSILVAPPGETATSWSFVQPEAALLQEVRASVEAKIADMRRLGMQPMTQKSGSVTATATSIETAKSHSVLQAWALGLKDALEQALVIVSDYTGNASDAVSVDVFTDFTAEPFAQAPLTALSDARKNRDISRKTYWDGLQRFDVLPSDFDAEAEDEELAAEQEGLVPEMPIDPATGTPIESTED